MIATRAIPFRIRYIVLFASLFLLTWQIYKYTYYGNRTNDEADRNNGNLLNLIKESRNKSQVLVSVYYEALCPDSRSFFIRHLLPTFLRVSNAIEIELIPYGKAKTKQIDEDRFTFDCQHGSIECFANKIHSCAIHYVQNAKLLLQFVTCMIDNNDDPESIGSECANKFKIPWKPILNCASGTQGNWLLKKHGDDTNRLNPSMSFVPTVLLNKNHHNQALILKDLHKALCTNYRGVAGDDCDS